MTTHTLHDLATPALVLDKERLERNAERMRAHLAALGVGLRPHVKTAKSVDVTRVALGAATGPITVSTLREAEHFADHGFDDIVLAVCITPDKAGRALALAARGVSLGLIVEDAGVATALADAAHAHGTPLDVLVEVDVGEHRTGVDPDDPALLEIARCVHDAASLRLAGVLGHAGQSYACHDPVAVAAVAEDERRRLVHAAARLADAGLPCPVVSGGSTPTAVQSRSAEGLTEMRPGCYLLGDLFQAAIGSCGVEDVAASVLATVISCHPGAGRLVVDAGALALSKDRSTAATADDSGYGRLADLAGRPLDLCLADVHQEHGEVRDAPAAALADLVPGRRVRVLPNHACLTAAAYDRFHVVEGSAPAVVAEWPRVNGW